jgi:peptidyl-prolyl cis-trans isomerase SurA
MAKKYSEDFGSAKLGGRLGEFGRGRMVPEFEEVAFKMDEGKISEVFESQYGFHIIKLNKRTGEVVDASHILLIPKRTSSDDSTALEKLNDLRELIDSDSLTFQQAALQHSDDEATKSNGGAIKNPQNGEFRIPHDMLDADFFFKVDRMKEGDITEPLEWIQPDGTRAFHIIYLKKKIPAHTANLEEDYQKLMSAATQTKQGEKLEDWFDSARENIYIEIKDKDCQTALINWIK